MLIIKYAINVFYQNARGLRTKTNLFKRNVGLNCYDIISITETWLLDGISDSELFDDRYLVWRRDRDYGSTGQRLGGGVMLAVRREFAAAERLDWRSTAEDIWVTMSLRTKDGPILIHMCTIYLVRQGEGNSISAQLNNFTRKLEDNFHSAPNDLFLIVGDFNMPNIDWDLKSSGHLDPMEVTNENQIIFLDTVYACNLEQYNNIRNTNGRLLDLVYCNSNLTVSPSDYPLVPEDPHHRSICIELSLDTHNYLSINKRTLFNYKEGNYAEINTGLGKTNWDDILSKGSINECVGVFYRILTGLRNTFVPSKITSPGAFPTWYSSALKKVLKEKFKYFKKFKNYGNQYDYETYSLLRERAKKLENECYQSYIGKVEDSVVDNPRFFWSYTKSLNKSSHALPSIMKYEDQSGDTGETICNLFSQYFQSTFLDPCSDNRTPNLDNQPPCGFTLNNVHIDPKEIQKLLKTTDLNKGAGPDGISPYFIRQCADNLVSPLTIIFKRSLGEGIVPVTWKSAFVTPVHKSGDRSNIKNYRPISKLCIFAKIFEKIIHRQVYAALQSSFTAEQHGFLKNKSTVSNLLVFNDYTSSHMDLGQQVDTIFTDFSKAFDRIDHVLLLEKLYKAGIHGSLFRWFSSYIRNRSQAVTTNGFTSTWMSIPSGVPQGSLLGPLLFVIFINDIATCFKHANVLLYADDTKIFMAVNNMAECQKLQSDLDNFVNYSNLNKLDLNISKCFSMSFTRKPNPINYHYTINNNLLSKVTSMKDLGLIQDSKLLFDKHIDKAVKKASKSLGFVIRSTHAFKSIKPIKVLYSAYVRSILEYASVIWNPQYDVYISRIESIQKKFLRYLQFKSRQIDHGYDTRCKRYHFLPLEVRRKVSDLACLLKIVDGSINCPELLEQVNIWVPRKLPCRRPQPLAIPRANTNYRRNSFFLRAGNSFNQAAKKYEELELFQSNPKLITKLLTSEFFGPHSKCASKM